MRKIFVLLWLLLSSWQAAAQTSGCNVHFFQGATPTIERPALRDHTLGLCFEGFAILYSGVARAPLWSAEKLTRDSLQRAREVKRHDSFHAEVALPPAYRAELSDFARSGYDRGHMAPAADMPSIQAQHESFSLANIVAQNRHNNQILWSAVEGATRHLTNLRGELYVMTGPMFEGEKVERLNGRVFIPTHVFKAVLDPVRAEGAAWIAPNNDSNDYTVVSIAELERRLQITLFPKLPPASKRVAMDLPALRLRQP